MATASDPYAVLPDPSSNIEKALGTGFYKYSNFWNLPNPQAPGAAPDMSDPIIQAIHQQEFLRLMNKRGEKGTFSSPLGDTSQTPLGFKSTLGS